MMKEKPQYHIYLIMLKGNIIYVGRTTNIKTRQNRHNLDYRKGVNKKLYNYLREQKVDKIELIPFKTFSDKIHSKRMEMYILLQNYFDNNMKLTYHQRIPNIKDGI